LRLLHPDPQQRCLFFLPELDVFPHSCVFLFFSFLRFFRLPHIAPVSHLFFSISLTFLFPFRLLFLCCRVSAVSQSSAILSPLFVLSRGSPAKSMSLVLLFVRIYICFFRSVCFCLPAPPSNELWFACRRIFWGKNNAFSSCVRDSPRFQVFGAIHSNSTLLHCLPRE
jgi:hypothetical protein